MTEISRVYIRLDFELLRPRTRSTLYIVYKEIIRDLSLMSSRDLQMSICVSSISKLPFSNFFNWHILISFCLHLSFNGFSHLRFPRECNVLRMSFLISLATFAFICVPSVCMPYRPMIYQHCKISQFSHVTTDQIVVTKLIENVIAIFFTHAHFLRQSVE